MKPRKNPQDSLLSLAGRTGFRDHPVAGLPVGDQVELFDRLGDVKSEAGMTTRQFLALDRHALTQFCRKYACTRAEVRFAQSMVRYLWQGWRVGRFVELVARERQRRTVQ